MQAHLMHEGGHEVQFCTGITSEKRNELRERIAAHEVVRAAKPERVAVNPRAFVGVPEFSTSISGSASTSSHSKRSAIPRSSFVMPTPPKRQSTLDASWDPKKKEEVDTAVARFFFHDNISFNVAR